MYTLLIFFSSPNKSCAVLFAIIFFSSVHIKSGGGASRDLIGCFELNWDCGCVNCGASSFVGVDSLDKTRFCFSLGHPSIQRFVIYYS